MSARKRPQGLSISAVMMLVMGIVVMAMWYRNKSFANLPYASHMEDTALTIDGEEYQLKDLAFYLASQESKVQKQARAYDLTQPQKYWNAHTNGSFVRVEARDALIEHAVHDEIFYKMAKSEGLELTKEETAYMENQKMDFWNDLEEEGQRRLGVSFEEIGETFYHMALAQKKQQMLAEDKGFEFEMYNANGSEYKKILKDHTYETNEKLWKRLNFGNITVN